MNTMATIIDGKEALDKITGLFFNCFCNKYKPADPLLLHSICLPEVMITRKNGPGQIVNSLASFIEPRIALLTNGSLVDFEESEIWEETTIIGQLAQRQSRYQKSGSQNGVYFTGTGVKMFQFIYTTAGWKISAVIWEDDETALPEIKDK